MDTEYLRIARLKHDEAEAEHSLRVVDIADIARQRDAEARGILTPVDLNVEFLIRERNAARVDAELWRILAVCGWLTFATYLALRIFG